MVRRAGVAAGRTGAAANCVFERRKLDHHRRAKVLDILRCALAFPYLVDLLHCADCANVQRGTACTSNDRVEKRHLCRTNLRLCKRVIEFVQNLMRNRQHRLDRAGVKAETLAHLPPGFPPNRRAFHCTIDPASERLDRNWLLDEVDRSIAERHLYRLNVRLSCAAPVSYTHLRAHETGRNLVCRLLLEKKKKKKKKK